jgi:hypothetical protein
VLICRPTQSYLRVELLHENIRPEAASWGERFPQELAYLGDWGGQFDRM